MKIITESRAEQSRAEQSRAEQSRAEQSRAEQSRAARTVNFDNNEYGNLLLMLIAASTLSIFVIFLAKHFNPFPRLIGFWGRHTLFIMGFDYFSGMLISRINENFLILFVGKMILLTIGILIWNKIIGVISNSKLKEVLRF